MAEQPHIIEAYANTDSLETAVVVVGFTSTRAAWMKGRAGSDTDDWGDWAPIGTAEAYIDNEAFARLEGCPFKLGNISALSAGAEATDG